MSVLVMYQPENHKTYDDDCRAAQLPGILYKENLAFNAGIIFIAYEGIIYSTPVNNKVKCK